MKVLMPTGLQRKQGCQSHGTVFPIGKMKAWKAETWKQVTAWGSALSVGPGHTKGPQLGPEVAKSTNVLDAGCMTKTRTEP